MLTLSVFDWPKIFSENLIRSARERFSCGTISVMNEICRNHPEMKNTIDFLYCQIEHNRLFNLIIGVSAVIKFSTSRWLMNGEVSTSRGVCGRNKFFLNTYSLENIRKWKYIITLSILHQILRSLIFHIFFCQLFTISIKSWSIL